MSKHIMFAMRNTGTYIWDDAYNRERGLEKVRSYSHSPLYLASHAHCYKYCQPVSLEKKNKEYKRLITLC